MGRIPASKQLIMITIHKYPIQVQRYGKFFMPSDSWTCHAGLDPCGTPCIWAEVNTDSEIKERTYHVIGTGQECPDDGSDYCATFLDGAFVWHVYLA